MKARKQSDPLERPYVDEPKDDLLYGFSRVAAARAFNVAGPIGLLVVAAIAMKAGAATEQRGNFVARNAGDAVISEDLFAELTGTNRKAVRKVLAELCEERVIVCRGESRKGDDRSARIYAIVIDAPSATKPRRRT